MTQVYVVIEDDDGNRLDRYRVLDAVMETDNEYQEVRTNPAMFAALAGAPADVVRSLPGETEDRVLVDVRFKLTGRIIGSEHRGRT